MLTAEVAIYPLKAGDVAGVINHSIDTLNKANVSYSVDPMKTHLSGTKEDVFKGLESMFTDAQDQGADLSMVVTITNTVH